MKKLVLPIALYLLSSSPLMAADALEAAIGFSALVRVDDADVINIDRQLAPGGMESIALEKGYTMEITSPSSALGSVTVILEQQAGEDHKRLHTMREPVRHGRITRFGYLICGDDISVISPAGESLPACP